jgi:omega-6 fatty acid desaturase (delta-12 desaturase)
MSQETSVKPGPRERSLNDVRAIIPESCYERSVPKATKALVQASVLYVLPMIGLAITNNIWALLGLWALTGLAIAGLFVLGHDASHNALLDSRRMNRIIAQVCMGPSVHVESAWDLGHNRIHHGYTSRQGFDFVWHPLTTEEFNKLSAFAKLRHRFEWSAFGSGAYFLREVWWQKMWRFNAPGKRHDAIVRDKIVLGSALAVFVVALAVLGAMTGTWLNALWMPTKMLVIPFLVFMQIFGWTVYVHHVDPEIRWWARREWSQFQGQMESTTILDFPKIINYLWFYNIFVHVPHHVDARLPFHQLPKAAAAIQNAYPDTVRSGKYSARTYLNAVRTCKLYDFETGTWLPYSAARS